MPEDKTSIRELIWLARLRQQPLVSDLSPSDEFCEAEAVCAYPDCLPWEHKRFECVRLRRHKALYNRATPETPIL